VAGGGGDLLARGGRSGERKNAGADDRADAQRGQIERGERTLHQAIRMFRFPDQKLRAFRFEKLRSHVVSLVEVAEANRGIAMQRGSILTLEGRALSRPKMYGTPQRASLQRF
jgi:hypothetical protein